MSLRLYNTLSHKIELFRPIDPAHITFYTCGPTVYDDAHIGNFRSFLAADVLRRFLESPLCELEVGAGGSAGSESRPTTVHRGPRRVTHVMNITDVGHMTDDAEGGEHGEDKMEVAGRRIAEAKKAGKLPAGFEINPGDPYAIATFYAGRFLEDARKVGLKVAIDAAGDPSLMPRATANVPGMIRVIGLLIDRGHGYVVGNPGQRVVYFDVRSFPAYGRLSGNTLDALREGAGGRIAEANQSGKRDPADFLLWKEDSAHVMKWESPWGTGYPGWHIECSVMSAARLARGATKDRVLKPEDLARLVVADGAPIIDVHSGGEDNIFPHHECEIAQSCCAFNASHAGPYAGMWFHPRFLFVEGAKMSKSKGNFYTVRQLSTPAPEGKGIEPAAIRFELIKTHYRSNANFTLQGMTDSLRIVERWRRFMETASGGAPGGDSAARDACRLAVSAFLHDDLNVAGAIGEMNAWISKVDRPSPADAAFLKQVDGVLGVLELERAAEAQTDIGLFIGCDPDPAVIARLVQRVEAKKARDFARSDAIRAELAAMGYAIKDVAGGKVEVRRG